MSDKQLFKNYVHIAKQVGVQFYLCNIYLVIFKFKKKIILKSSFD